MSYTSVRPIAASEVMHAQGQPAVFFTTYFGMTAGILFHMSYFKLSIKSATWFPSPLSRTLALLSIGGGALLGNEVGYFLFARRDLERLVQSHELDNASETW